MIADGMHELPQGKIAAVVTYLEMLEPPQKKLVVGGQGLELRQSLELKERLELKRVPRPNQTWYRELFRKVGEEWLWFSRLSINDDQLRLIIHDPKVEVYVLLKENVEVGFLELDFRQNHACELGYFGLTRAAIGTGAGRFLMQAAVERAWSSVPTIQRFHVHTCTLDHPAAVGFYIRSGFTPYRRAIEIADDPRLDGRLSPQAAGWFPVV